MACKFLNTLTGAELISRSKLLHNPEKRQSDTTYCIIEKNKKKVEVPKNSGPTSFELGKLMDIALHKQLLTENTVLYALFTDTLTSFKCQ